jgi:DnaJ family protein C protein 13
MLVYSVIFRYEFFNEVYHRFLLSAKSEMRCICLKAMAVTYGRHWEAIGPFTDTRYLVAMLAKCTNAGERDHLLMLLSKLILHKQNVRELITANGVPMLVDLATLAHLHVSRAHVHGQVRVVFFWE